MTVSDIVSIDEHADGYLEVMKYRNLATAQQIAPENKDAMECYLEEMIQGTTMKQKAYGTLVSPEMHAETVDQLVSLPLRAVVLRQFEEEMRITPRIHALIAIPYVRTEQLRFACCVTGLTMKSMTRRKRKDQKKRRCSW